MSLLSRQTREKRKPVFSYYPCCIDSATIKSAKTEHTYFFLVGLFYFKGDKNKEVLLCVDDDPKQLSFISVKSSATNSVGTNGKVTQNVDDVGVDKTHQRFAEMGLLGSSILKYICIPASL